MNDTRQIIEEGDLVAAVCTLHHAEKGRGAILAGTCGIVTESKPGARFVRVDFDGEEAIWVSPLSLRVIDEQFVTFGPPAPDAVGTLWDIVSEQAREIHRLQAALSGLLKYGTGASSKARAGDGHS